MKRVGVGRVGVRFPIVLVIVLVLVLDFSFFFSIKRSFFPRNKPGRLADSK